MFCMNSHFLNSNGYSLEANAVFASNLFWKKDFKKGTENFKGF